MALVIGALPIAATPFINSPAKKFTAGLLQEQEPLIQDVDVIVWPLPFGHEQSEAFLHDLGLIKSLGRKRARYEMFVELHCSARGIVLCTSL